MDSQVEIEYETIALEADLYVVFRIDGFETMVNRSSIIRFDYEGRLWILRESANLLGITPLPVTP